MGEIEFGKCDICGKEAPLNRTYFIYDIHCDCCGCKEDVEVKYFIEDFSKAMKGE